MGDPGRPLENSSKNQKPPKTKKTKVSELTGPMQGWEGLGSLKTPQNQKTKKQRFQNLLGLLLGRPLRAVVFFVFFGSQGLGSGPGFIFRIPNLMGLIGEPRKTWRRLGTSREAGEGFGRPGVTWDFF